MASARSVSPPDLAVIIETTKGAGAYQYGAGYWNHLIFRFVPAQLLGADFKQTLMMTSAMEAFERNLFATGYEIPTGSTMTGMGDSFQQFGWAGCLFFALLAVFMRSLWHAALQPHAVFAQLFYIIITTSAMRSVTHWTLDFLPAALYFSIFLGIGYLYARDPEPIRRKKLTQNIQPVAALQPDGTESRSR